MSTPTKHTVPIFIPEKTDSVDIVMTIRMLLDSLLGYIVQNAAEFKEFMFHWYELFNAITNIQRTFPHLTANELYDELLTAIQQANNAQFYFEVFQLDELALEEARRNMLKKVVGDIAFHQDTLREGEYYEFETKPVKASALIQILEISKTFDLLASMLSNIAHESVNWTVEEDENIKIMNDEHSIQPKDDLGISFRLDYQKPMVSFSTREKDPLHAFLKRIS